MQVIFSPPLISNIYIQAINEPIFYSDLSVRFVACSDRNNSIFSEDIFILVDNEWDLKVNFIAEFYKRDATLKNDDFILTPEMKIQRLRRQKILELSANKNNSNPQKLYLNMLVLEGADSILNKLGKECIVVSEKKPTHKLGECYHNAANMMDKYVYVEGYAIEKNTDVRIAHAWNIDSKGNYFDTTFKNAEEYNYFGVIIPKSIVYEVGFENGGIWYAALPFIDNLELNQ